MLPCSKPNSAAQPFIIAEVQVMPVMVCPSSISLTGSFAANHAISSEALVMCRILPIGTRAGDRITD